MDAPASPDPPDDEVVHVDGRDIPFRAWEGELMLRAAAWLAIVQGALCSLAAWDKADRWLRPVGTGPALFCAALVVVGLVFLRSDLLRGFLIASAFIFVLLLRGAGGHRAAWSLNEWVPMFCGLGYAFSGFLLLGGRPIARDVLLILSGLWLVTILPRDLDKLIVPFSFGIVDQQLSLATWLLPPAYVFLTLASRIGRALFTHPPPRRLAPLWTIRGGRMTARGWASAILVVLTLLGSVATLEYISRYASRNYY